MTKKELRLNYIQKRKLLSFSEIDDLSLEIANQVLSLPIWSLSYYHIFLAITEQKEIDTNYILSILQGKDKNIVIPRVKSKETLEHFLLTDSTLLQKNALHIPEPIDGIEILPIKMDVVFIPLLAFDKNGNRIGYGKGYYDRFLAECKPGVIKIGISLFPAEEELISIDRNDVPLDYCITPKMIYSFSEA